MNTRISRKKKINEKNITLLFLEVLNNIKLFHWNTPTYASHKAADKLYEKLNEIFDMFIEILLRDKRLHTFKVKVSTDNLSSKDLIKKLNKFEKWFMEQDLTPELCNLRDEAVAQIRQFYYLMKLK